MPDKKGTDTFSQWEGRFWISRESHPTDCFTGLCKIPLWFSVVVGDPAAAAVKNALWVWFTLALKVTWQLGVEDTAWKGSGVLPVSVHPLIMQVKQGISFYRLPKTFIKQRVTTGAKKWFEGSHGSLWIPLDSAGNKTESGVPGK